MKIFYKSLLSISALFYCLHGFSMEGYYICVIMGAETSYQAVLPTTPPSLGELSQIKVASFDNAEVLSTEKVLGIVPVNPSCQAIHLTLNCAVEKGQEPNNTYVKDLKEKLISEKSYKNCEIHFENDAVNCLKGTLFFQNKYQSQTPKKSLVCYLSTAIGLAYFDGEKIVPLEITDIKSEFEKTYKVLGTTEKFTYPNGFRYLIVGRYFWKTDNCKENDKNILCEYKKRYDNENLVYQSLVKAFIEDIIDGFSEQKKLSIEQIIIGGERASCLNGQELKFDNTALVVLNKSSLMEIDQPIIPMLACYFDKKEELQKTESK